ncbi:hypothetical protein QBC39DRAFT_42830 [Podospora conica]|nr:hypothetical protein QBC39DRAFT_42830 [Schizothecium conicum]
METFWSRAFTCFSSPPLLEHSSSLQRQNTPFPRATSTSNITPMICSEWTSKTHQLQCTFPPSPPNRMPPKRGATFSSRPTIPCFQSGGRKEARPAPPSQSGLARMTRLGVRLLESPTPPHHSDHTPITPSTLIRRRPLPPRRRHHAFCITVYDEPHAEPPCRRRQPVAEPVITSMASPRCIPRAFSTRSCISMRHDKRTSLLPAAYRQDGDTTC